ncbi:MAG: EamA family transporter [Armatimonadota bacterium]
MLQHPLVMLFIALGLGSVGQLSLKIGMEKAPEAKTALDVVKAMITQPYVTVGMLCYVFSSLMYLRVIQKWDLSLVYPMVAFSYVLVTILSWALLHEKIPLVRVAGLVLICLGVCLMAASANSGSGQTASHVESGQAQSR